MSLFVWAVAVFGMAPVMAATNTSSNYQRYTTRYSTPTTTRTQQYRQYDAGRNTTTTRTVRQSRTETVSRTVRRKYYLAHPFFQPLGGKFGSVTDLSYNMNSYDFSLESAGVLYDVPSGAALTLSGTEGKWKGKQLSIKEDFSYGFTDKLAVIAMLRYDHSDYRFKWSNGPDDTMKDDGLNMFGIGGQWRFADNEKWIGTASLYFEHQKDIANSFILDLKAGYKVSRSTIYGLARGWFVDFDGDAYGNGVEGNDANGLFSKMFLAYDTNVSSTFYAEGGLGVFSVLDEDWTMNLEAILGYYDWHNQGSIKGAIGWQPNDWFALNLYARTVFYDSANDKKVDIYYYRDNLALDAALTQRIGGLVPFGTAKLDNYSETTIGVQAIFQF